jgi:hypothetical protein
MHDVGPTFLEGRKFLEFEVGIIPVTFSVE